jgi:cytidine deaminase
MFSHRLNVEFMNSQIVPKLCRRRKELADLFGENWIKRLHVAISLLSGPAARFQALSASLRQFRPDYLHVSEVKTFWHGYPSIQTFWDSDVELLHFEDAEYTPALELSHLDTNGRLLVLEMIEHKKRIEHTILSAYSGKEVDDPDVFTMELGRIEKKHGQQYLDQDHELDSFWLRKTKQPVLSVLLVQKENDSKPRFFRGINIEVSMPTGSLCAERSAIGSALASDPTLKRKDMKMIAVLSLTLNPEDYLSVKQSSEDSATIVTGTKPLVAKNPIAPCGSCMEWLRKISAANPDFRVLTFENTDCRTVYVKPIYTN